EIRCYGPAHSMAGPFSLYAAIMPTSPAVSPYIDALSRRVIVFDGAMGTSIQSYDLTADDFGGTELNGCNDYLVVTRPDVIEEIHSSFLAAGCDVIETDTFRSNRLTL